MMMGFAGRIETKTRQLGGCVLYDSTYRICDVVAPSFNKDV